MITIKRIYDAAHPQDGFRVLIDRLWPRGISKEKARLDLWAKDIAPSTALRKWFNHEPEKFKEFAHKYVDELNHNKEAFESFIKQLPKGKPITLLYAAHDPKVNQAVVLQKYMKDHI